VPVPLPFSIIVNVYVVTGPVNVAVTVWAEFIVTVQVVPVPEQPPPDQPVKVDPEAGDSVSVTEAPCVYWALQVGPQFMPPVLLVTVPVPVPALEIVNV
jgi:hypothetical protein